MSQVKRLYVEKKPAYAVRAKELLEELRSYLSLDALEEVRRQGYALEDGEYKVGLRAVAAPVRDAEGILCCALGAVGLFPRVQSEEFQQAVARTVDAAARLSAALGYRPNPEP